MSTSTTPSVHASTTSPAPAAVHDTVQAEAEASGGCLAGAAASPAEPGGAAESSSDGPHSPRRKRKIDEASATHTAATDAQVSLAPASAPAVTNSAPAPGASTFLNPVFDGSYASTFKPSMAAYNPNMAAYKPTWRDTYVYNPVMGTYNMGPWAFTQSMQPHFIPTPVVNISLRVASMDGTTLDVTVPERGLVREVKRVVGQVAGCDLHSRMVVTLRAPRFVCAVARDQPELDGSVR